MLGCTLAARCARGALPAALALVVGTALDARPVHADTIDTILGYLAAAGVVDKAVVDAKPLIECMLQHAPTECVDLQSAAVDKGKAEAAKVLPSDPKVKTAIAVIKAVDGKDWFLVLELTSTDLLGQIACDVAMAPTAAVKTVVCGPIFAEVSSMAKPVVKGVIHAFASNPPDIWALVTLLGLPTACEIAPDMPLKDQVCGILGQAFAILTDAAAALANEGWGLATDVGEVVSGQSDAMPQAQYYAAHWQRWQHLHVLYGLRGSLSSSFNSYRDACIEYFDGHKYSASHAEEACKAMEGRFAQEVQQIVQAMKAGQEPYYQAHMAPLVDYLALQRYWSMDGVATFMSNQAATGWPPSGSALANGLGDDYAKMFTACLKDMEATYPLGYRISDPMYPQDYRAHPGEAWGYACFQMFAQRLAPALAQRRAQLASALSATGCKVEQMSWGGARAYVNCDDYDAYQKCRSLVPAPDQAQGNKYCAVNGPVANKKLAQSLATRLGKRCLNAKDNDVDCTRPWRVAECEYFKTLATEGELNGVYVYCKDVSASDSAFVAGKHDAAQVAQALNGGGVSASSQTFNIFLPPTSDNCYTDWDPLAVICQDASVLQSLGQKLPGTELPKCPPDPNRDGADSACYAGPLNALAAAGAPVSDQPFVPPASEPPSRPETGGRGRPTGRPTLKADLVELPNFSVGGRTVGWGTTVSVDAAVGSPAAGGGCRVVIRHFPRNVGEGPSGPFSTEWRNSAMRGSSPTARKSLAKGEFRQEVDEVVLYPNTLNALTLLLDPENQVTETDEANNEYKVTVRLSGTCGARGGR